MIKKKMWGDMRGDLLTNRGNLSIPDFLEIGISLAKR